MDYPYLVPIFGVCNGPSFTEKRLLVTFPYLTGVVKIYKFQNEEGIDKKSETSGITGTAYISEKIPTLACHKLLSVKVGIFSLSYAVIPSFLVSVLFIDPLKFINFYYTNLLVIACSYVCNEYCKTVLLG